MRAAHTTITGSPHHYYTLVRTATPMTTMSTPLMYASSFMVSSVVSTHLWNELCSEPAIDHSYRGHNYIGHNYIRQNCISRPACGMGCAAGLCVDTRVNMWIDVCTDACVDMRADACLEPCMNMRFGLCIDTCVNMCVGTCTGMRTVMRTPRHSDEVCDACHNCIATTV